MNIDTTQK